MINIVNVFEEKGTHSHIQDMHHTMRARFVIGIKMSTGDKARVEQIQKCLKIYRNKGVIRGRGRPKDSTSETTVSDVNLIGKTCGPNVVRSSGMCMRIHVVLTLKSIRRA